ncbi:MAG: YihY/virulence factor BrkB family protein, partial [Lentisphaeria bacterium]|nr:YihY/virulence factor BrkB family protein [Lentisphaeria bacterium]
MIFQQLSRFRKILWFSTKRYAADNHSQRAVALTYYTVFAIVPMAALLFGIAKGFDLDVKLRTELSQQLYQHKEILEWVCKFADTTLKQAQGGIVAGVGVIALIWTVLWLASNIERAFNDVWGLPSRKNIFRRFSDYLALILLTPLVMVVVGASGVALRSFLNKTAGMIPNLSVVLSVAADLSPLVIAIVVFTLIYKFAPNTKVRFGSALLAGVIAGLLFQLVQDGFIFLQGNIFKYNRIYGTFAVLPLFLVWLQWSWQIALFGAEVGFVSQNIDSGVFDGSGNSLDTMRMRRANQLACAALIYRGFADGQGGVSINEIS